MQKLLRKNTIRQHKNSRQTIFYLIKMNKFIPRAVLFLVLFLGTLAGFSQEYTAFTRSYPSGDNFRYQTNIKGDITFIVAQLLLDPKTLTTIRAVALPITIGLILDTLTLIVIPPPLTLVLLILLLTNPIVIE
jgi:hypothetical protein